MNNLETIRRVISEMRFLNELGRCITSSDKGNYITIIDALEKQIPKKPSVSHYNVAFCPVCHGSLWQIQDESHYCFRCGQTIDWNESEVNPNE